MDLLGNMSIPPGLLDSYLIPFSKCPVFLSVLPAVTAEGGVPWSVYFPDAQGGQEKTRVFSIDEDWGYPEFLIHFCKFQFEFVGRIDYTVFLFQKPLIFGMAFIDMDNADTAKAQTSFYFSRHLCSKDMSQMLI